MRSGKDNRQDRVCTQVPMFTKEELEKTWDEVFAALYPGEAVSEEDLAAGVPAQRAAPYESKDWKEVGITSQMCIQLCKKRDIALRVLYKNKIVYDSGPRKNGTCQTLAYQIFSDHAYFYDNHQALKGVGQLSKGPLKLAMNEEPEPMRLRVPADEDPT